MQPGSRFLYIFPVALNLRAHWADRVRAAAATGAEVHVAVPMDVSLEGIDLGAARLHDIPLRRGRPSLLAEGRLFLALWRLVGALRPDFVHAVTMRPVAYGGIIARLRGVPAVLFSITGLGHAYGEGTLAGFFRFFIEQLFRVSFAAPSRLVTFENAADRDVLVGHHVLDAKKARVFIGGGLDLDAWAFASPPQQYPPVVVLAARLIADKGVREFVEAARLLQAEGVAARFCLVGEVDPGNPATLASGEIGAWTQAGLVEHWGWREDMPEVLRGAAIVCLPSWYREGAPRSLIEAAAIGRPSVTTDLPGCRDVVQDRVTGLLVPPRNAAALAAALRRLIVDPGLRAQMGRAARNRAERHFSSARAIAWMLSLYDELLPGWRR
jgi:glycosyltransferase involved in cell wall biosynthesis